MSQTNKFKELFENFKTNKKAQIIAIVIAIIIVAIITIGVLLAIDSSSDSKANENSNISTNTINTDDSAEAYRIIDGVKTIQSKANLLPVSIVVENLSSIRPQKGLSQANIVYEALAEGGITRFLAVYANSENIATIGPVRSARHYFVDISEEYGGIFAHIGGSPQALGILSYQEYLTDLNQFTYSQYYWRDENIPAPHNLFTSSELMTFAVRDLISENPEGDYKAWEFKDANSTIKNNIENALSINFSLDNYKVDWTYDAVTNSYLRYNGGEAHTDANTDKQLSATNIVVQYTETGLLPNESERLDIQTLGSGKALICMQGECINGSWEKAERGDRTMYLDANGDEIEFIRGNTWIEIVKSETEVSWKSADGTETILE